MTRAAPARSLGLENYGHLGPGAMADITVYKDDKDREKMFSRPEYVFKNGAVVVTDGKITDAPAGSLHTVKPEFDNSIERDLRTYFNRYQTVSLDNFKLSNDELLSYGKTSLIVHPCK